MDTYPTILVSVIYILSTFILNFSSFGLAQVGELKVGFYRKTCPAAEEIIRNKTAEYVRRKKSLAASLLRIQFHDCFVRGCDASLLLRSTKYNQAEKDAEASLTLRGFHVITAVKSAVEKECPGVVSCADIVAIAARDAVATINGPFWRVATGRRDGMISNATEVIRNLPPPFAGITQLKQKFRQKGLHTKDLVVLSGAHTIGISHCSSFSKRLYNFAGNDVTDPTLDPDYVIHLKRICKPGDTKTTVEMVARGHDTFDEDYYDAVAKRRGLLGSDAALLDDEDTRAYVERRANSGGSKFRRDFRRSMVRLGAVGVLTQGTGEIRKNCGFTNDDYFR